MRTTTPLVLAALLAGRLTPALAQNTPDSTNANADAPFVRHVRPDHLGQTTTAGVLRLGQVQLEAGGQQTWPASPAGPSQLGSAATLRLGFWNSLELRVTQGYQYGPAGEAATEEATSGARPSAAGWAPLRVGTKIMLNADRASRFQASALVEATVPNTGGGARRATTWGPGLYLLLSQQLGRRAALEGNFGFRQAGLTLADALGGQYAGSLAFTGPLGEQAGFFVEGYGRGRHELSTGASAGLYFRPWTGLRFDAALGRALGGPGAGTATLGLGLSLRLGGNRE